jgi:hypothetical protein
VETVEEKEEAAMAVEKEEAPEVTEVKEEKEVLHQKEEVLENAKALEVIPLHLSVNLIVTGLKEALRGVPNRQVAKEKVIFQERNVRASSFNF